MYILIDNFDSFTYNLYQYLAEIGVQPIEVIRNNRITVEKMEQMDPEGIIISPGPGRPEQAGITVEAVRHFAGKVPILGVCLGHQAIGYAFGARITGAGNIVHGKTDAVELDGKGLFRNIPTPAKFTRYHSLVIDHDTLPDCFEVTARSSDGEVMGIRHKDYILEGIQFHPESIASEYGKKILKNFIRYKREAFHVPSVLTGVLEGKNLSQKTASYFMEELTDGQLTNAQIAAFLAAFNAKGVAASELAGLAAVLNKNKVRIPYELPLLDTCGTGGDQKQSFNISSLAAIVACSCGVQVAKHGNRGVSSKSGSADFYTALGIPTDLSPDRALTLLKRTGFVFLFAPLYHRSMKHAAQVRRELGIKTIMNMLGPLVNPADADYQLIGVYSEDLLSPMSEAAMLLGKKRTMVVHGLDGFDEISVISPTRILEIDEKGNRADYTIKPEEFGIEGLSADELRCGNPEDNARTAVEILTLKGHGALREAVQLNAGAALYISGRATDIREGYNLAKEAIESKMAMKKLEEIIETGKSLA